MKHIWQTGIASLFLLSVACKSSTESKITLENNALEKTHLKKQGTTTQLIVDGAPYLILGGELGNSSFTSMEYMKPIWPNLKKLHVNTILAPVFWELIEPREGEFDFKLMDELVNEAKNQEFKLVLLWFGSWKNSMSSHVPAWVKRNQERFPRAKSKEGISQELLSPFSKNNLEADSNAFMALMERVKYWNKNENVVIMVQPENEIGMLPSARDHHHLANTKYAEKVPTELMDYLNENKDNLMPSFKSVWEVNGFKQKGNWEEVFGKGAQTEEIFMAWFFAKFVNEVTKKGKEIYDIPMFVNAALNAPHKKPGEYPSAGPLPHLMDVWKAATPQIDFLSPDFYNPNFKHWNDLYTTQGDPLFIPEHHFNNTVGAKALFALGHYEAIGFSPFSIESKEDPENETLGKIYGLVQQCMPLITSNQGQNKLDGALLEDRDDFSIMNFGDYKFTLKHTYSLGWETNSKNDVWDPAGALVVQTAEKEFFIIGDGVMVSFENAKDPSKIVGILKNEEGYFEDGNWKVLRHLNGDQTHQGRHVRMFHGHQSIQRLELYDYE